MEQLEYSDRLVECRQILQGIVNAACTDLGGGDLRLEFAPQKRKELLGMFAVTIMGVLGIIAALTRQAWMPEDLMPLFESKMILILIMSIMCACIGPLILVVHLTNGGSKPTVLEIRSGQLRADRWIS